MTKRELAFATIGLISGGYFAGVGATALCTNQPGANAAFFIPLAMIALGSLIAALVHIAEW